MQLIPLTLLTLASLATALPASSSTALPANTQSCKAHQDKEMRDGRFATLWYDIKIGAPYSKANCENLKQNVIVAEVDQWYSDISPEWTCKKTAAGQIRIGFDGGRFHHENRINYGLHNAFPLIGFNCPGT
ncbi:hypothetical protein Tdes44962_MAKER09164 [Teratosphaeria destructans]|uniref:Uncharacterized protein n=1 Tax=Teratosphaeria destructans TaxID=418781 RepID=A0A9W7W3A0_9PEZI|nr:hypothetical protein Tdes44962_MAKER09164 [Teratosphaeria destructans]